MGSSIAFFNSKNDYELLYDYAKSIGLLLVPPTIDRPVDDEPQNGPFCYLSHVPLAKLRPYGDPPIKVSDVTDPLILFMRAYYKDSCLVLGQIHWNSGVPGLASITKPYYQKLVRWIRKSWQKKGDFYYGPEAILLLEQGAKAVNFLPGQVNFKLVEY